MKKLIPLIFIIFIGTLSLCFQTKYSIPTITKLIELKNKSENQLKLELRLLGFKLVRDPSVDDVDSSVTYMFSRFRVAEDPKTEEIIQYTQESNGTTSIQFRSGRDLFLHYQNELKLNKFILKKCSEFATTNSFCYSNGKYKIRFGEGTLKHIMYDISIYD